LLENYYNGAIICAKERIKIEKAPEPTDVVWENMKVGFWTRIWKITQVFLATLVLIGICFICIYALDLEKRNLN
jgi:uncharacterized membrane protein